MISCGWPRLRSAILSDVIFLKISRVFRERKDMASLETPVCDFGWKAINFDLLGVDGKRHSLASAKGENGLLVMFICNHCPYVKAVQDRIIRDVNELKSHGINAIAIMSNDPADYPEDSFENMALIANKLNYQFFSNTYCLL